MSGMHDRDIELLLGGRAPDGLENLSVLVRRVRREASLSVDPAMAREHISAAAAAVHETPTPVAAPGSPARHTWRRRTVFAGLFSTIIGKILVGAAALATVAAGAGATGAFPDPVDRFFGVDNEPVREQIQDQEQLGEEQQVDAPNLFEYQEQFEFSNQGTETIQNQFQNQNQFQRGVPVEEIDESALLFHYRHAYQGDADTTTTTAPHMLQLEHQQGVDQGTDTTLPQNQQQAQQQGLDEETNTTQQQQAQQQQTGPGNTTSTTGAGAANGGPGGNANP